MGLVLGLGLGLGLGFGGWGLGHLAALRELLGPVLLLVLGDGLLVRVRAWG